jgi:hypothetical protein
MQKGLPERSRRRAAWPPVAGAVAGLAVSWAALAWLARRHRGAGVLAGGALVAGAAAALLARFAGGG